MIEKLTKAQEENLSEYRDKWLKIGLSCEPCDVEKAWEGAKLAYKAAGLAEPKEYLLYRSPLEAARKVSEMSEGKVSVRDALSAQIYGCHDAAWLGFYDFFYKECNIQECEKLKGLWMIAESCGWWAPYKEIAIFQHRPKELHFDSDKRLHHESGPSVLYRDGFSVYCWKGTRVPKWVIMQPEKITPDKIDKENNIEVRRVMMERFGVTHYILESKAELIHEDEWGKLYKRDVKGSGEPLMMVKVVNSTPESDGTFKDYFLLVHHELRPLPNTDWDQDKRVKWLVEQEPQELTARNAVASTFGLKGKEYNPFIQT